MKNLHLLMKVQAMLLTWLVAIGIYVPADGWADEMLQPGSYATVQVLETRVLFQDLPEPSDAAKEAARMDVIQVYPMDEPGGVRFIDAAWVISPAGTAAMRVPYPAADHPGLLTVSGSWGKLADATSIHLAGQGPRGLLISLDGLLEPQQGRVVLDALWTVSVRDVHHVERIRLQLGPAAIEGGWAAAILPRENASPRRSPGESGDERLLSEPTAWIGGVPLGTAFDVTLDIALDESKLPLMAARLLLNPVRHADAQPIDLTLTTEGAIVPGWSAWTSILPVGAGQNAAAPGVSVTAANGVLTMAIAPSPKIRSLSWYVRDPEHPEQMAMALVETGTITLRVTKDAVEGSIQANGTVVSGSHPKSAFRAAIHGTRVAKNLVSGVLDVAGRRAFDGKWTDKRRGDLTLQQTADRVDGKLQALGDIAGAVSGRVADLHWRSPGGEPGNGFLAVTGAGLLVGLTWAEGAITSADAVVAMQGSSKTGPVTDVEARRLPTTDDEAQQLKLVGYDLAQAGKYQQAAEVLTKALRYFVARSGETEPDLMDQKLVERGMGSRVAPAPDLPSRRSYVLAQGVLLVTLSDSAFRAGDYDLFVYAVHRMIRFQRAFNRSANLKAGYTEHAEKYRKTVNDAAGQLQLLSDAYERGRKFVTRAGIGVRIELVPDAAAFRIAELVPDMPAEAAGIAIGDVVAAIDGIPLTGISLEEATRRLGGVEGSTLTLTMVRDGRSRNIRITRAPLFRASPERRSAVAAAMTSLMDLSASAASELRKEASRITNLDEEASRELPCAEAAVTANGSNNGDAQTAFENLLRSIQLSQETLRRTRAEAIQLAQRGLSGEPATLDLFQRTIAFFNNQLAGKQDANTFLALDREDNDLLKNNPQLTQIDKDFLDLAIALVGAAGTVDQQLMALANMVTQIRSFAERASQPADTAKVLNQLEERLTQWRTLLITDAAKIEAMDLGSETYATYVDTLAEFELADPDPDLARQSLLAAERARERATADLLRSRSGNAEPPLPSAEPRSGESSVLSEKTAPPLTPEQLGTLVRDVRGTVLEYFVSSDKVLIWVVQAASQAPGSVADSTVQLRCKSVGAAEVHNRVEALRSAIEAPSEGAISQKAEKVLGLLQGLYDVLIAPVADLLPKEADRPVIIVPHKDLWFVPFAALARPASDRSGDRYFIEDHALLYVPSLEVLRLVHEAYRGKPWPSRPSLLAVVNPAFGNLTDVDGKRFQQLPQFETGIGQITQFYDEAHTRLLKGKDASRAEVMAEARSRDVIMFLTHAEASEKDPYEGSYIALAGDQLRVRDIAAHRLDARLVIFGACETGRGRVTGDGILGLGRMTLAAGAEAMLVSIWHVPDMATLQLIADFHTAWDPAGRNAPFATALREAQLSLLAEYPKQVEMWAGFIQIGDPR